MKVIFKDSGKVQDVSDGFARNYLIPRGLAILATTGELRKLDLQKKEKNDEEEKKRLELELMAKKIDGKTILIQKKSGEDGKLFGSVTNKEIVEAVFFQLKIRIDKHNIDIKEPIKYIGRHELKLSFGMGISAKIVLEIKEV